MPKEKTTPQVSHSIIPTADLDEELKKIPVIVQQYIEALKTESLKAQQQIVKFKAESVSYKNRAAAAEKELHEIQSTPPKWEGLLEEQAKHPERDVMISIPDPIKPGKHKSGGRP